jgi:hypothetical protein
MQIISYASHLGKDQKGNVSHAPAIIEVNVLHAGDVRHIRFFSLAPKDEEEAIVINAAAKGLVEDHGHVA